MAEKRPQTFANHRRLDPLYHLFALPIFGLSVLWSVVHFIRHPGLHSAVAFVVLVAATVVAIKTRTYSLRVQDRVIRLEERLRLALVLSEPGVNRSSTHWLALCLRRGLARTMRADVK
jgi:hypothetical protein